MQRTIIGVLMSMFILASLWGIGKAEQQPRKTLEKTRRQDRQQFGEKLQQIREEYRERIRTLMQNQAGRTVPELQALMRQERQAMQAAVKQVFPSAQRVKRLQQKRQENRLDLRHTPPRQWPQQIRDWIKDWRQDLQTKRQRMGPRIRTRKK